MAAATTAILAGTALAGAYVQSQAIGLQNDLEKQQAKFNAKLLDVRSKQAIESGEIQATNLKKQAAATKGSQKAASAGSGVVTNFGSTQDVQNDTDLFSSINAEKIKNNAALEAWGYQVEKINVESKAKFSGLGAKNQQAATLLTGGAQILGAFKG